jgi:hypothetical protein
MRIHRLNSSIVTVFLGLTFMTLGYQNCAKAKFAIDDVAKQKALGDVSVFEPGDDGMIPGGGNTPGDDGSVPRGNVPGDDGAVPRGNLPGDDGAMPRVPTIPGMPPIPGMPGTSPTPVNGNDPKVPGTVPAPGTSPVPGTSPAPGNDTSTGAQTPITVVPNAVCGPALETNQASLPAASKITAVLYKLSSVSFDIGTPTVVQVWDSEADKVAIRAQLASMKSFTISTKVKLTQGNYGFVMYDSSRKSAPYTYSAFQSQPAVAPILDSVANFFETSSVFSVNSSGKPTKPQVMNVFVGTQGQAVCATAGSIDPLVLQLNTKTPKPIIMTAPEDGVMFDLLGQRLNHKQVKTAWFASSQTENYFLVLPDKNGLVLGIDELFGDATLGPDKKFAKQGFAALEKFDDNKDKIISEDDDVFSKLKLWKDDNLDGVAQGSELHSLDDKDVVAIDLRYDKRFQEVDKHGNMTKYKSIVVMKDNSYGLVYDLWLRFINK